MGQVKKLGNILLLFLIIGLGPLGFLPEKVIVAASEKSELSQAEEVVLKKISFFKADLGAVLQELAGECGYNIIISPKIAETVTLQLTNVTFPDVLKLISQSNKLVYRQEGRNFIINKSGEPGLNAKTVGYFPITYGDPKKIAEIIKKVNLNQVLLDEDTRTIIITGSQTALTECRKIIQTLDRKRSQLTIDFKIIEIASSGLRTLCTELELEDAELNWGMSASGMEMLLSLITNGHKWSLIFKHLVENGKAHLVTAPSIAAIDGSEASILIGDKLPIETRDADGVVKVEYMDVGVNLKITPRLQQQDEVLIDLSTQVNTLGTKVGSHYIIGTREAKSRIQAKIGETVFVAGLINQKERDLLKKVPLLAEVPLLGRLFRSREKLKEESELILTITPKWHNSVELK